MGSRHRSARVGIYTPQQFWTEDSRAELVETGDVDIAEAAIISSENASVIGAVSCTRIRISFIYLICFDFLVSNNDT